MIYWFARPLWAQSLAICGAAGVRQHDHWLAVLKCFTAVLAPMDASRAANHLEVT